MVVFLFWFAAVGALFSYFIYPLLLRLTPKRPGVEKGYLTETTPQKVSLIVTAHNEAHRIQEKQLNDPGLP